MTTVNFNSLPPPNNTSQSLFNSTSYKKFYKEVDTFTADTIAEHYKCILCLNPVNKGREKPIENAYITLSKKYKIAETLDSLKERNFKKLCVLPKGHTGKCSTNYNKYFMINKFTKKLISSIDLAIYSTPGNDDYVYKNRASRLFPIIMDRKLEKKIRDKKNKLKCAIPLKDASTPFLLACAYLDWMTFILKTVNINKQLKTSYSEISTMINVNQAFLKKYYKVHNRKIFDKSGHSICVITTKTLQIKDFADPDRDNREDISDSDVQLGHVIPRSDEKISIRGCNLVPMSRRGNLILGDKDFRKNIWLDELKSIVKYHV